MVKGPILKFKSMQAAYASLREWKERLFLSDWIIKLHFCDQIDDGEIAGKNEFQVVNKYAVIYLLKYGESTTGCIAKFCHEEILVHELLHCKYNWLQNNGSMESVYYDAMEHALLEQMAKSLIMAKYDLPFSWFQNFKEDEE